MANQTDLSSGNHSCILEVSNLAFSNLAIDSDFTYAIKHLGLDNQGGTTLTLVKFSTDQVSPDPTTFAAINNQRWLQAGDIEFLKRGGAPGKSVTSLSFKAANAANAVLVQVSFTPTITGGFDQ